jgi:hypothetical protein
MSSERSKKTWHVISVLIVFTLTGCTTAWLGRQLSAWLEIERFSAAYWLLWIVGILPVYNVLLPIYGALFGKYSYFREKQKKLWRKITCRKK